MPRLLSRGALLISVVIIVSIYYYTYRHFFVPKYIILITIDSLRADHLGCYGYYRNTSPEIDSFSKKAAIFNNAFTTRSETPTAIASLLTGLYSHFHHVRMIHDQLPEDIKTLPFFLHMKKYITAAFVGNHILKNEKSGLGRYFDTYVDKLPKKELNRDVFENRAPDLTDSAIRWIESNCNKSFFLWVHYQDPHHPYDGAPEKIRNLFTHKNAEMVLAESIADHVKLPWIKEVDGAVDANSYIDAYDSEIRLCDKYIGKLLKKLDQLCDPNKTLIIITADHGESLGKHGRYFVHGLCSVYDDAVHIPLIIRYPGIVSGRINEQVSLVDIVPTILEIIKFTHDPQKNEGESLVALLLRKPSFKRKPIFIEKANEIKAVRTDNWKFIMNFKTKQAELYNLKLDPDENNNIINYQKEVANTLHRLLLKWINSGDFVSLKEQNINNLNEEEYKVLKSLGYLQ